MSSSSSPSSTPSASSSPSDASSIPWGKVALIVLALSAIGACGYFLIYKMYLRVKRSYDLTYGTPNQRVKAFVGDSKWELRSGGNIIYTLQFDEEGRNMTVLNASNQTKYTSVLNDSNAPDIEANKDETTVITSTWDPTSANLKHGWLVWIDLKDRDHIIISNAADSKSTDGAGKYVRL